MLRLWRDLYRVVLHPHHVTLSRVRKAHFSRAEAVEVVHDVESHAMPVWKGAVDQLRSIVSGMPACKADVEIVLSNHFARYVTIPWGNDLTANEASAMVRIRFEEVYGSLSDDWEVRFSEAGYGEPGIACAIDREMMEELSGIFNGTSLSLISVQPFLMAAFNRCSREIGDEDFLLLLNEPGRVGMVRICKRQWASVRLVQSGNSQDELRELLRRETLVSGMDLTNNHYVVDLADMRAANQSEGSKLVKRQAVTMEAAQ